MARILNTYMKRQSLRLGGLFVVVGRRIGDSILLEHTLLSHHEGRILSNRRLFRDRSHRSHRGRFGNFGRFRRRRLPSRLRTKVDRIVRVLVVIVVRAVVRETRRRRWPTTDGHLNDFLYEWKESIKYI